MELDSRYRATLRAIFADPVRSNVLWSDVEALLVACGADLTEGNGSRLRIALGGIRAVVHRPHPRKETDKGALKAMLRYLTEAGFAP